MEAQSSNSRALLDGDPKKVKISDHRAHTDRTHAYVTRDSLNGVHSETGLYQDTHHQAVCVGTRSLGMVILLLVT